MKLVSINAVLIASCNASLAVKSYCQTGLIPTFSLVILSLIFIALLLLLQYQHRQFKNTQINISESSWLFRKYIYIFAIGIMITLLYKSGLIQTNLYIENYIFLSNSIHFSLLYFTLNFILGVTYLNFFQKQYLKASRNRIKWDLASNSISDNCIICYNNIQQGQKIAKISCMHKFHSWCLNRWVKQKPQCPICKFKIQIQQY